VLGAHQPWGPWDSCRLRRPAPRRLPRMRRLRLRSVPHCCARAAHPPRSAPPASPWAAVHRQISLGIAATTFRGWDFA
jgi:hypothetical protein